MIEHTHLHSSNVPQHEKPTFHKAPPNPAENIFCFFPWNPILEAHLKYYPKKPFQIEKSSDSLR